MRSRIIEALIIALAGILSMSSCTSESSRNKEITKAKAESDAKALALLVQNCFACHSPDMAFGKRVTPPMFMVRAHYFDSTVTEDEFVKRVTHFINNPIEENSIMPGAVRNFGLMPKQMFKEEDLTVIAKYIFQNDLESKEWYAKWEEFRKTSPPVNIALSYEDMGLNYANGTKSELGKNLLAAIKERGPDGAVEFCNTRAIPLTDSMSKVYNASIRRVSDKPRNPANLATDSEAAFINELKINAAGGEKLAPKVFESNGTMTGYYPIQTNKMCLQCHGTKGQDINKATITKITELYPDDKATGYAENEIRGVFVVEMAKK